VPAVAKTVAMHVAAAKPKAVSVAGVSAADLEREKEVLREEARASGKGEHLIEKMVAGRLRKFYKEWVLLEQDVVIGDSGGSVASLLSNAAAASGFKTLEVTEFARYKCGEVEAP
jgi:elongation factor Ts